MRFKEGEILSNHTTFCIGGLAKYFCIVKTDTDLFLALKYVREKNLKVFVLGCGSNVLISDKGFDGLVIKIETENIKRSGNFLTVEAGLMLGALLKYSAENNLSGLEFLSGIPGAVGGALCMNAGQLNKSIGYLVKKVWVVDRSGREFVLLKDKCEFGYRSSIFQKKEWIIIKVEFVLQKGVFAKIKEEAKNILSEKLAKQPYDMPSAGSFFKNPTGDFAGRLIDAAGCKGMRVGGAQVSLKHANFIVNSGDATFDDVKKLSYEVIGKVKEKFNVVLEPEV